MEESNNNPEYRKRQRARRWNSSVFSLLIIFSTMKISQGNVVPRTNEDFAEKEPKSIENRSSMENNDTCGTPECFDAASEIISKMDPGVNPCDDFYRFACGKFLNTTFVPFGRQFINAITINVEKVEKQLKTIIESEIKTNEPAYFALAKKFYKSCMNIDAINALGFQPLFETLESLGGWPILNRTQWNETDFDWIDVTHKLRKMGYFPTFPITARVLIDPKNATRHIIQRVGLDMRPCREFVKGGIGCDSKVDQAHIEPPREDLVSHTVSDSLRNHYLYILNIVMNLGASLNLVTKELSDIVVFQKKLANITVPKEDLRNYTKLYNPMTLTDMTKKYPDIHWGRYLNGLMPPGMRIRDDDIISVSSSEFMKDVSNLIAVTPKRVLANYIILGFVRPSIEFLKPLSNGGQNVNVNVQSNQNIPAAPKDEYCLRSVAARLPTIVDAMYVRKYADSETRRDVIAMTMGIRHQFGENLKKTDWLDEETRRHAREKVDAITNHISYPDELLDDAKLERIFQNVELSDDKYYENAFKLLKFGVDESFAKLPKPPMKNDVLENAKSAQVNGFYNWRENSIVVTAGMLQDPLFNSSKPKYMNYAGIGDTIGHELIHGFDDQGRQYDKTGNLLNWWSSSTEKRYLERVRCIIEQYSNYTVGGGVLKVNGINTQSENIADNDGIKLAYHAYVNWSTTNEPEKKLPGLPYTPKQMFWLSFASTFCTAYTWQGVFNMNSQDTHSLAEFRINGPLSNAPEFSDDFNCPVGSNMNPEKKCNVW